MNKVISGFTIAATLAILAGCAGNKELAKASGVSTRQNVFQEIAENAPAAPGYVDLRVYSSLKTHKPGIYSNKDIHGTQDYMLTVNIDGQAVKLKGRLTEERSEARSLLDHEAGEGIRYQFTIKLRLKAGPHRVVVALPADDLVTEKELILPGGENILLVVEPVYGAVPGMQKPGTYGLTGFKEGIKSIRLLLNGKTI